MPFPSASRAGVHTHNRQYSCTRILDSYFSSRYSIYSALALCSHYSSLMCAFTVTLSPGMGRGRLPRSRSQIQAAGVRGGGWGRGLVGGPPPSASAPARGTRMGLQVGLVGGDTDHGEPRSEPGAGTGAPGRRRSGPGPGVRPTPRQRTAVPPAPGLRAPAAHRAMAPRHGAWAHDQQIKFS